MSRRMAVTAGIIMLVAILAFVLIPWKKLTLSKLEPTPSAPAVNPAEPKKVSQAGEIKSVSIAIVKSTGGPCTVTITGGSANSHGDRIAPLQADAGRSLLSEPGPFTIDAITVERDGKNRRHEPKVTIPAGETREIRINADDTIEIVTPK